MTESPSSAVPGLPGLALESVEWLPSGADSGLVRVRARWTDESARQPELPVLALVAAGSEHRFESLPDARFSRDPASWRGTYLVPAELVATDPSALWLEWPGGARAGLPALTRGVEPPRIAAAPERPEEPAEPGGQVIDRAVLAERRARRAEASEEAQSRVAAEALKAVEVLELRSAELERRLEEAAAERDALAARPAPDDPARADALAAALASAAELRARSREWQLRLRSREVAGAGDAVRLAVLEAERATATAALRAELAAARRETEARTAELEAAKTAAAAHAEARLVWDRGREELETELDSAREHVAELRRSTIEDRAANDRVVAETQAAAAELRGQVASLEAALVAAEERLRATETALASAEARLRVETVARTTLEDELDRERAARAAVGEHDDLRRQLEAERAARRVAEAALAAGREDAKRTGATLQERIAELERRASAADLQRVAREHAAARPERPLAEAAERLRADLDAAEDAVRRRTPPPEDTEPPPEPGDAEPPAEPDDPEGPPDPGDAEPPAEPDDLEPVAAPDPAPVRGNPTAEADDNVPDAAPDPPPAEPDVMEADGPGGPQGAERDGATDEIEPAAPDAEPASEWAGAHDDSRAPVVPGVEPVRRAGGHGREITWALPGVEHVPHDEEGDEPPAPDCEPGVEWATPPAGPVVPAVEPVRSDESCAATAEPALPTEERSGESPTDEEPSAEEPSADEPSGEAPAAQAADPAARPAGPRIVSASKPPPRALMVGRSGRAYPLLRGAIVKLAHDDPATAGRVLAALLPAQGAAMTGSLSYDLTIAGTGTFGVTIAGGRATVVSLARARPRARAAFHLRVAALILGEMLAGVEHRIGWLFGPVRLRGRKRPVRALRALPASRMSLTEAAQAGAPLTPELVYRVLAYAVHPSWTRGHSFTIAQTMDGERPETWYLTARDGAGLSVSTTRAHLEPDATVTMSRDVFDRLLRGEAVAARERPAVRGDHEAVAALRAWTQRVQGAAD